MGWKLPSRTEPHIRFLYDCSSRKSPNLPSLNDCLESTPPILSDLTNILVRFRTHRYAATTDIEKAFLHIGLDENDRDATRFLWSSDVQNPDSPLITYRFKSVLFGATCSPFILSATILKHLENIKHVPAAEIIERDIYVDNVLSSFENEADLLKYFEESRKLMAKAGMNLRAWNSNSAALRSQAAIDGVLDAEVPVKILGMRWDLAKDEMSFAERNLPILEVVTKRTILRYSSQIYDPLGLLSPVTVSAKILLQELSKDKYDWDTPLPDTILETWNQLAHSLNKVTAVKFPRQFLPSTSVDSNTCLHVFVDASVKSYGAAAYICNQSQTRLVMAKNRVAPIKTLTLPQLELMAALVGARLASHLQPTICASTMVFWSDSQIVLHWLTTSKPVKCFVRNRVEEIHQLTGSLPWRYCPTDDNPADLLTRGITADAYLKSQLWDAGPVWLSSKDQWPTWEHNQLPMHIPPVETVDSSVMTTTVSGLQYAEIPGIHRAVSITKYSSYLKLLRVTAYTCRFINNCKHPRNRETGSLTANELHDAEIRWLKSCQSTQFQAEIASLKTDSTSSRLPLVKQLRLYLDDDGLVRCGGRIHNAPVEYATKFPYLLPKKHELTKLIVSDAHTRQLHSGVNSTVIQLRQKFWIPSIRQCVRSVLRTCVKCTRVIGRPYRAPDPPPLPIVRVEECPPFSVTGVDFTGALYVKNAAGSEKKCYICLFTCATTRAVHLEVVPDLSTDSFLQAFRRFASRKSMPTVMISDNATTYIVAANHLKMLINSPVVHGELSKRGVEWRFIPARAPWYGGFWERLIGLTKTTLKKVLGRRFVSMETLQTIVTEIEAVMNDRPLTHVSSSIDDWEPLTPSHLLYGRNITPMSYHYHYTADDITGIQSDQTTLTNRARTVTNIISQFWKRWRSEYLTGLREYHRATGSNEGRIRVGDVVQIHDEGPRIRWNLAVVEELITGRDGSVRAAKVKTKHGLSTRPVVKLYPIEIVKSDSQ